MTATFVVQPQEIQTGNDAVQEAGVPEVVEPGHVGIWPAAEPSTDDDDTSEGDGYPPENWQRGLPADYRSSDSSSNQDDDDDWLPQWLECIERYKQEMLMITTPAL